MAGKEKKMCPSPNGANMLKEHLLKYYLVAIVVLLQLMAHNKHITNAMSEETKYGLTVYAEPCVDECKQRGFPYTWCHKNFSRGGTWPKRDYCSHNDTMTRFLDPCLDSCHQDTQEKLGSFYWCRTNTSRGNWDYCSPLPSSVQVKLDKANSDPGSPRSLDELSLGTGDTAANITNNITTWKQVCAQLKDQLISAKQEDATNTVAGAKEGKEATEENSRLPRTLQLEMKLKEALCRHLPDSESSSEGLLQDLWSYVVSNVVGSPSPPPTVSNSGVKPVDGSWLEFGPWSECSDSCETSRYQLRMRYCYTPTPQLLGADCAGHNYVTRPCEKCREVTSGYSKQNNTFCKETLLINGTAKSYSTFEEAIGECNRLSACQWIYDWGCDGNVYYLCSLETSIQSSLEDSCVYYTPTDSDTETSTLQTTKPISTVSTANKTENTTTTTAATSAAATTATEPPAETVTIATLPTITTPSRTVDELLDVFRASKEAAKEDNTTNYNTNTTTTDIATTTTSTTTTTTTTTTTSTTTIASQSTE